MEAVVAAGGLLAGCWRADGGLAAGRLLGGFWEASGGLLGDFWGTSGGWLTADGNNCMAVYVIST